MVEDIIEPNVHELTMEAFDKMKQIDRQQKMHKWRNKDGVIIY